MVAPSDDGPAGRRDGSTSDADGMDRSSADDGVKNDDEATVFDLEEQGTTAPEPDDDAGGGGDAEEGDDGGHETDETAWRFDVDDVDEDGIVDRSIEPEPIDPENALFVLLGIAFSLLVIVRAISIFTV